MDWFLEEFFILLENFLEKFFDVSSVGDMYLLMLVVDDIDKIEFVGLIVNNYW